MADLVQQGKVRALGLSEARPETIRRAHPSIRSPRCRASIRCSIATEAEETLQTTRDARHRLRRLFAARAQLADRRVRRRRHSPKAMAAAAHPRFPPTISRATATLVATDRGGGDGEGLHSRAGRACLAAGARRRHRADSRHQAAGARRRESGALDVALSRRRGGAVFRRRSRPARRRARAIAEAQLKAVYL